MDETPDEKYYVFESNSLCMTTDIEEYLSDVFIQKDTEQTSWTIKDYEEGQILFKGIPIEHNPIIKEVEMVMHPVAQTIGEIEVCEEMKQLEGITEIEEFLIEYVFQDKEASKYDGLFGEFKCMNEEIKKG